MKVLVTGSTGFVGKHMVEGLLDAGHEVRALTRGSSLHKFPKDILNNENFSSFDADVTKPGLLKGAANGCDAVIHLVGIIGEDKSSGITFENYHEQVTHNIIEAAREADVKRFLHMSALGARMFADSRYHRTKYNAETAVQLSGIPWTIFRPSLIFGEGDGFVNLQKKFIQPFAPIVVPGGGTSMMQPVAIEDVVSGFIKALDDEESVGKIYEVGGPEKLKLVEIIDRITEAKKAEPTFKISVPIWLLREVAAWIGMVFPGFPINRDQLIMLGTDNTTDTGEKYFKHFGITDPKPMTVEAIRAYI